MISRPVSYQIWTSAFFQVLLAYYSKISSAPFLNRQAKHIKNCHHMVVALFFSWIAKGASNLLIIHKTKEEAKEETEEIGFDSL